MKTARTPSVQQVLEHAAKLLTEIDPECPCTVESLRADYCRTRIKKDGTRVVVMNCTEYFSTLNPDGTINFSEDPSS